jgi:hypothetical protein
MKGPKDPINTERSQISVKTESMQLIQSVAYNVQQDLIVVTRDKVELCLTKHVKSMEQRHAWLLPFGVFFAAIGALATSSFHAALGLKAEMWNAIYILIAVISGCLTVWLFWKRGSAKTVHQVIDELKAKSDEAITPSASTSSVLRPVRWEESLLQSVSIQPPQRESPGGGSGKTQ